MENLIISELQNGKTYSNNNHVINKHVNNHCIKNIANNYVVEVIDNEDMLKELSE